MIFDLSYKITENQCRVFARNIEAESFEEAQAQLIEYWLKKAGKLAIAICIERVY